MDDKLLESVKIQLDELKNQWDDMLVRSKYEDVSDLPDVEVISLITQVRATIKRISLVNSEYTKQAQNIISTDGYPGYKLQHLMGVVNALHHDLNLEYIGSIVEITHADVFDNYLDMANHLLEKKYKDPAAVIAGTTLEIHLRKLCLKNDIEVFKDHKKKLYKRAEGLNGELKSKEVYATLDNKNITAWLDLRNDAAHGKYKEYNSSQVKNMILGIEDFMNRYPT